MQGTKAEPGVIPRVVRVSNLLLEVKAISIRLLQGIFEKKETIQKFQTSLSVSYMEIYKDEVYDLFVTRESASFASLIDSPQINLNH